MIKWRTKVIRAQQASTSFVVCTRARLQALSIRFDTFDHERLRMYRQEERRLTGRKDSTSSNVGPMFGSVSITRSRLSSVVVLGGTDEKRAIPQILATPIELQRLQQMSVEIVKIPRSIKWQLLTDFLAASRKEFQQIQRVHREKILCVVHARKAKLEEARAIVQGSNSRVKATDVDPFNTRSTNKAIQPPFFSRFSNVEAAKKMEDLVCRGVQLTLDADPELRALYARQQEHRLQSPLSPFRRSSINFSAAAMLSPAGLATSPTSSSSCPQSVLKKPA